MAPLGRVTSLTVLFAYLAVHRHVADRAPTSDVSSRVGNRGGALLAQAAHYQNEGRELAGPARVHGPIESCAAQALRRHASVIVKPPLATRPMKTLPHEPREAQRRKA